VVVRTRLAVVVTTRAAAVLALLGAALAAPAARAQFFSPGPLSRPHAALEGLASCARCHDQSQRQTAGRCLACHVELAPSRERGAGLHGRLPAATRDRCPRCHPEHRGPSFALVDWPGPRASFDHRRAGFALEGAHGKAACAACHDARHVVVPEIARLLKSSPQRTTFLGLAKRCGACHFDEHRGQLGGANECQRCHDERAWKPAPRFEHGASDFPLRGKHAAVACARCHATTTDTSPPPAAPAPVPRAATFLRLAPVEHATCASCHRDPHEGKLGHSCAACHTEEGWALRGSSPRPNKTFHDATAFPLVGAHADVACKSCHGPFPGAPARYRGLAFGRCGDCHVDAHLGQLAAPAGAPPGATTAGPGGAPPGAAAARADAKDCGACHSAQSFAPARFEVEQHAATPFPLEGGHRVTPCRACHPQDARLAARVPPGTRARLEREHRPLRVSTVVLRPGPSRERCSACHADPHAGQFAAALARRDCAGCHTTASFRALAFDHDADSAFALTGAHARAACGSCHKRPARPPGEPDGGGPAVVRWKPLDASCGSCHRDPHAGQFTWQVARADGAAPAVRRADAIDCGACHPTTTFTETTFRHDDRRFTTFALEGKHAEIACRACHKEVRVDDGSLAVRYRPLPRTCSGCHVDFHKGDFRGLVP
jgi:hypothetical protein